MRQLVIAISCICMVAAICEQMLDGSRYFPAIRTALGMRFAAVAVSGILAAWKMLNG